MTTDSDHTDSIADEVLVRDFSGAKTVSWVMKVVAVFILLGGLFSAAVIATDHSTGTNSSRVVLALAVVLGSVPIAALWAWFGYVLEVLVEVAQERSWMPLA